MSASERRDRFVPGETRPDLDLLTRPAVLPPADEAHDRFRALRDLGAALRWIVAAWRRPAGAEARWEQRAGRSTLPEEPASQGGRNGGRAQARTRTTGTGH